MTGAAVLTAARAGAARRLVQTLVVLCVLGVGAAAGVLGLTLATSAGEGFYAGCTAAHCADLAVSIDASKVTAAELAATHHLPGVTGASGYPETYITTSSTSPGQPSGYGGPPGGQTRTQHPPGQPARGGTPAGRPPVRQGSAAASPSPTAGAAPLIPRGFVRPNVTTPGRGICLVGRASAGGPLEHLTLLKGRLPTRPGEIALGTDVANPGQLGPGATVTITSAPGKPALKLVGIVSFTTSGEQAVVVPSELAALRPHGQPALTQMLYTFTHAATAQQIGAGLAEIRHALPAGAVINWTDWLYAANQLGQAQGINTPFAVAYGIIALVLAVLITASVVSAAVVASYRRIGVLKSIGFTPAQVAAAYLAQIGAPALAGAIAGTALGNSWVVPLLNAGPGPHVGVPLWINLAVPLGLLALTGLAAAVPALRAGRLPAVAAIAAGQAPRAGHGYTAHRLAGKLALPRPVSIGLAAPFTRPARSAVTLGAVTFGLAAVVLAVGLDSSIAKIDAATTTTLDTVLIGPAGATMHHLPALTPAQQKVVAAAVRAQPGTLGYLTEATATASVPGVGTPVRVIAYSGDAARLGWDLTAGTWYTGPREAVVNTAAPGTEGLSVGETIRMIAGGKTVSARITGEVYAPAPPGALGALFTSQQTLAGAGIHLAVIWGVAVVKPASQQACSAALQRVLGPHYDVGAIALGTNTGKNNSIHGVGDFAVVDTPLVHQLTVIIAILAALGVLNTVLMLTRERVHDLGVFKAVGMTPRQAITMVTCWAIPPALAAAIIGLPAGMALQDAVIHATGVVQGGPAFPFSLTPGSVVHVYTTGELALLALAGLGIAIAGALGPATWAAVSRTTTALRAE
jgi:putative ABC transport system permease protein